MLHIKMYLKANTMPQVEMYPNLLEGSGTFIDKILERICKLGIVPVVKIEDAKDAYKLGKALIDSGLPIAEITFRTSAAEESIKILKKDKKFVS